MLTINHSPFRMGSSGGKNTWLLLERDLFNLAVAGDAGDNEAIAVPAQAG